MIHDVRDQHGLSHVINQGHDSIFIAADIENGCRSLRIRVICNVRLAKQCLDVLEIAPARLAGQLEPILKRVGMLATLRPPPIKLS